MEEAGVWVDRVYVCVCIWGVDPHDLITVYASVAARVYSFAAGRHLSPASGHTLRWGLRKHFSVFFFHQICYSNSLPLHSPKILAECNTAREIINHEATVNTYTDAHECKVSFTG